MAAFVCWGPWSWNVSSRAVRQNTSHLVQFQIKNAYFYSIPNIIRDRVTLKNHLLMIFNKIKNDFHWKSNLFAKSGDPTECNGHMEPIWTRWGRTGGRLGRQVPRGAWGRSGVGCGETVVWVQILLGTKENSNANFIFLHGIYTHIMVVRCGWKQGEPCLFSRFCSNADLCNCPASLGL